MAKQVLVAAVVLCVVLSMGAQVNAQMWSSPAPAPYMRGWVPSSAPSYAPTGAPEYVPSGAPEYAPVGAPEYAPVGAPEYAPVGAPELSPMPALAPYVFVPSPSISFNYPNMAPGPMSA